MIDVKQAVAKAIEYVCDMFAVEPIEDVRLEEVELSEDDEFWHITLSFLRSTKACSMLARELQPAFGKQREYKVVALRSSDGQVQSMKIRQLV